MKQHHGPPRLIPKVALLLSIAILPACQRDATFCTYAEYEAMTSGFRIQALAGGTVLAGHDLSSSHHAEILICPVAGQPSAGVRLTASDDSDTECEIRETGRRIARRWTSMSRGQHLLECLQLAGFENLDPEEVEEGAGVIDGVTYGPKGTVMKGQAESLVVLEVDCRYATCSDGPAGEVAPRMAACRR